MIAEFHNETDSKCADMINIIKLLTACAVYAVVC